MEEAVELFISPGSEDPQVYYELQLSPANVSRQVRVTFPHGKNQRPIFDDSWHCNEIKTETYVDGYLNEPKKKSKGWQGIFSIPFTCFSDLDHAVKVNDVWRVNVFRIDRWPEEMYCAWLPTFLSPPSFHSPEHFGHLLFTRTGINY